MKVLIMTLLLFFSSAALSAITINWVPGAVVPSAPVDEWLILCKLTSNTGLYGAPTANIPETGIRTYDITLADGEYDCIMRAVSNINPSGTRLVSINSTQITFTVKNGVQVNTKPNPPSFTVN